MLFLGQEKGGRNRSTPLTVCKNNLTIYEKYIDFKYNNNYPIGKSKHAGTPFLFQNWKNPAVDENPKASE